jgi:hypothetical protein
VIVAMRLGKAAAAKIVNDIVHSSRSSSAAVNACLECDDPCALLDPVACRTFVTGP